MIQFCHGFGYWICILIDSTLDTSHVCGELARFPAELGRRRMAHIPCGKQANWRASRTGAEGVQASWGASPSGMWPKRPYHLCSHFYQDVFRNAYHVETGVEKQVDECIV
jgi:hypothetical protein